MVIFSCKKSENSIKYQKIKRQETPRLLNSDTLIISMKLPPNKTTGLNISNYYGRYYYLDFINPKEHKINIIRKIPVIYKNQIINYYGGVIEKEGIIEYNHYYLIGNDLDTLKLEYRKGNVFIKKKENVKIADTINNEYKILKKEVYLANMRKKKKLKDTLLNLFRNFEYKFENEKLLKELNKYHYIEVLQKIEPLNPEIDKFMETMSNNYIQCDVFNSIVHNYIKNRINQFNFEDLNSLKYNTAYIVLLSKGMFNFLRHENNKGDKKYESAVNWLKTTDLYRKDSTYIKKEITPLNNLNFKEKIKKLDLQDIYGDDFTFSKIIDQNPSDYYLIDFWATWCKPCIEGIRLMNKMSMPKNVSIISLSLDTNKDKHKWKKMTQNLGQKNSYFTKNNNISNQDFLKFIELQSMPRYILIDKYLNLIDEAFLHPHEPQFLSKLKDVKNHKYW